MADGAFRRVIRRLVPRRLRWLAKAAFKRITGLYYRDIMRQQRDMMGQQRDITGRLDSIQHQATVVFPTQVTSRLDEIQHQVTLVLPAALTAQQQVTSGYLEAQGEVMDLMLRRLRLSGEEVAAHLGTLEEQVAARLSTLEEQMGAQLRTLEERVTTLSQPLPNELSDRTVGLLNYERSHLSFRNRFGLWINDPVAVEYSPEEVRWVFTNERVVEVPFTLQAISALAPPARIIDIGSCESVVPLELASLCYRVTALDIRSYAYAHPNLTAVKASILDWEGDGRPYDAAILLSTLEHLGLPVYGQTRLQKDADKRAMTRVRRLLRPGGLLVLTAPFGPSHTGETQRTYAAVDLARLLKGFRVQRCCLATQPDDRTWVVEDDLEFESLAGMEDRNRRAKVILISAERA
jgi:2-polyprenyl-3-methyl-5-hydroxy-6-metoxy-1,4-benzoquinol methylase